ncbi:hypothetical protein PHYPSEUDO_011100 [Phytophthora pseudosyringae]|uniref:Uncharacterized protein n=1 Tax=Phytophthora pseudosyringae TaxID=221518 RepID=A0A8T1W5B4_9STRA|nr:hypothetical protein PHYPSEUDO_011100 [Phytophthora pseudosyringae]
MQLIALTPDELYEENTFQPGAGVAGEQAEEQQSDLSGHTAKQNDEWCDHSAGPIYLCVKPKWVVGKKMLSCWDVWRQEYKNAKAMPAEIKEKIRVRGPRTGRSPGKSPAKRGCVDSDFK